LNLKVLLHLLNWNSLKFKAYDTKYQPLNNLFDLLIQNNFLVYIKLNSVETLLSGELSFLQLILTHCHATIEECHLFLYEAKVLDILAFLSSCLRTTVLKIIISNDSDDERRFHYCCSEMTKSINIDEYYLRQTEAVDELFSKINGFNTLQVVSSKRYHNTVDVNNEMILRIISKNTDCLEHLFILGTDTTEAMLPVVFATCKCLISLQLFNCYKYNNESYAEFSNFSNTHCTLYQYCIRHQFTLRQFYCSWQILRVLSN